MSLCSFLAHLYKSRSCAALRKLSKVQQCSTLKSRCWECWDSGNKGVGREEAAETESDMLMVLKVQIKNIDNLQLDKSQVI